MYLIAVSIIIYILHIFTFQYSRNVKVILPFVRLNTSHKKTLLIINYITRKHDIDYKNMFTQSAEDCRNVFFFILKNIDSHRLHLRFYRRQQRVPYFNTWIQDGIFEKPTSERGTYMIPSCNLRMQSGWAANLPHHPQPTTLMLSDTCMAQTLQPPLTCHDCLPLCGAHPASSLCALIHIIVRRGGPWRRIG